MILSRMDSNLDPEPGELDLEGYPSAYSPSLLDVAAAGAASRLAPIRRAARMAAAKAPPLVTVAVGLAVGIGLGVTLV